MNNLNSLWTWNVKLLAIKASISIFTRQQKQQLCLHSHPTVWMKWIMTFPWYKMWIKSQTLHWKYMYLSHTKYLDNYTKRNIIHSFSKLDMCISLWCGTSSYLKTAFSQSVSLYQDRVIQNEKIFQQVPIICG